MFTIPDRHLISSWIFEQKKPLRLSALLKKERNEGFLRQAEAKGYIVSPNRDYLELVYCKSKSDNLADVKLVKLTGVHLRNVGEIALCSRLTVCNLANNYITRIDALAYCHDLIKLDLHSNQVTTLPKADFWQSLRSLKILYLHNNCISHLECVHNIGAAEALQLLTLFDTPLSLKKSYRHHVVNSIWSLRALDHHVISDEEIIEDAIFGGQFQTMHNNFRFNPVLPLPKDPTYADELQNIQDVLQQLSIVQAKFSPVLIIQKYFRGIIARRKFKEVSDTRVWATVYIQRFWRRVKGLKWIPSPVHVMSPSKSKVKIISKPSSREIEVRLPTPPAPVANCANVKYMTHCRPGSTNNMPSLEDRIVDTEINTHELLVLQGEVSQSKAESSHLRKRKNILINLTLLQENSQITLDNSLDGIVMETSNITNESQLEIFSKFTLPIDKVVSSRKVKPKDKKRREFKTVKQMLGPLSDLDLKREHQSSPIEDDINEDEEPQVQFRLSGMKTRLVEEDRYQGLLISKREVGKDVREANKTFLENKRVTTKTKKNRRKTMTADQRLFARVQGTMGMSCLRAVQQVYKDRIRAEKANMRLENVMTLRERREEGKQRAKTTLEDKRQITLQKKDEDQTEMSDQKERVLLLEKNAQDKWKAMRSKSQECMKDSKKERTFSIEFNGQNTAISNALLRHDQLSKRGEDLQVKQNYTEFEREHQQHQSELVQRYLEHRKLMRQSQVVVEKAALDTKMLQSANDRLAEARNKVSNQRQRTKNVQAFYPLPKSATDPVLPPVRQDGQPGHWETMIDIFDGHVGNHPTTILTG